MLMCTDLTCEQDRIDVASVVSALKLPGKAHERDRASHYASLRRLSGDVHAVHPTNQDMPACLSGDWQGSHTGISAVIEHPASREPRRRPWPRRRWRRGRWGRRWWSLARRQLRRQSGEGRQRGWDLRTVRVAHPPCLIGALVADRVSEPRLAGPVFFCARSHREPNNRGRDKHSDGPPFQSGHAHGLYPANR